MLLSVKSMHTTVSIAHAVKVRTGVIIIISHSKCDMQLNKQHICDYSGFPVGVMRVINIQTLSSAASGSIFRIFLKFLNAYIVHNV